MQLPSSRGSLLALVPLALASVLASERPAHAVLTYYIYESGPNVVVQASGSLILPSISSGGGCSTLGGLYGPLAFLCTGPVNTGKPAYDITGPISFPGASTVVFGDSATGLSTGIFAGDKLYMDPSYVSGAPIASSATFNGTTLAGLGFATTGLLGTWTLTGTGGGDTINLVVGNPPSAVPGPLPLFGAAAAFGYSRRLRRRVSLSRSASQSATSISA